VLRDLLGVVHDQQEPLASALVPRRQLVNQLDAFFNLCVDTERRKNARLCLLLFLNLNYYFPKKPVEFADSFDLHEHDAR
jgi:hypothetical protein